MARRVLLVVFGVGPASLAIFADFFRTGMTIFVDSSRTGMK